MSALSPVSPKLSRGHSVHFVPLGEKENSLKTDDYGRDLSSVQTLLTKQVSTATRLLHADNWHTVSFPEVVGELL